MDLIIEETLIHKNYGKSEREIGSYESTEETKYPQEYDSNHSILFILDDLNEQEMTAPRVQALFKRSRLSDKVISSINQDYYELPIRTIRANGNIYHIFITNNFRDVQNFYQRKVSMYVTLNETKNSIFNLL